MIAWREKRMPDVVLWLAIVSLGWLIAAVVFSLLVGWFIKRGRYPPPH